MEALTPGHLVVILVGFLLLFGYRKLPEAARSLRIFRAELRAAADDVPDLPAELEAQARAAEAQAAALRARAGSPDGSAG